MNITKKIKLTIINNDIDERKKQYKFIRDSIYAQYLGLNRCMGYLMSGYYGNAMDVASEGFKAHQKNLANTLYIFDNIEFGKGIDSKSCIVQKIKQDFSSALKHGLAKGERSVANYKRSFPLMTRGRALKFSYDENNLDINIEWVNKIKFQCVLNDHKNCLELQHTLHKVINGEYKVGGSSIGFDKNNKLILNLNISIPETSKDFINGRCLGVDLGMAIPAYISVSDDIYLRKSLGKYEEFAKVRQQFKDRRRRMQKRMTLVKGGKGRKKKLHSLEYLKERESRFAKTYNHQLSRKIVDFAISTQCEYIKLEDINSNTMEDKVLGKWGYKQLQAQIEYKAKLNGIKVVYVNPKNTSRKCSKCGHIHEDNRKTQSEFVCLECGFKANADWNASINIGRSEDITRSAK